MRKAFLPLSGNVLERAAQVRQQQSMLRTLIRYTKETYQLGVINIKIGNEEEGHALVKEAQEIYKKLYGEMQKDTLMPKSKIIFVKVNRKRIATYMMT